MKTRQQLFIAMAAAFLMFTAQAQTVTWDQDNTNTNWNTTDANWQGGETFANGNDAVFDSDGETVTVDAGGVTPGSTAIESGSWRFEGGSILGGPLTHASSGTTDLTQANAFSSVDLSAGRLQLQDAAALGSATLTHSGGQTWFSFGDGSDTTVSNNFVLDSSGTQTFVIRGTDGAAPTTQTTVRLTGEISGGAANERYRLADTNAGGNMNNYLILDNPNNSFEGEIEIYRGFIGVTSDGALGNENNNIYTTVGSYNGGLRFAADNVVLNENRSLIFNRSDVIDVGEHTATIHGDLEQATSTDRAVRIEGTGTLIFTGTSSLGAGTEVTSGVTLQVGDGGTAGSLGSGNVVNDGTLVFNRSDNYTFSGRTILSGDGETVVRGGGVMTTTDTWDSFNSVLTIEEGGVISQNNTRYFVIGFQVGGDGLPNGAVINIEDGAFMSIDGNRNFDGDVDRFGNRGNVQVNLNGGTMNFLGDASARDNPVGTFTATNGGTVTVGENHRLDLNNSGGITTTGTGGMTISGAGSLNLAIRNDSGDSPVFNVGADAPLTINTDITSISVGSPENVGGLGFEQTGDGVLTLNGINTYTGDTNVTGGTLLANGSLISDVFVSNGATLGGTGTLANVNIAGGTLSPGNSAGVLTLNGDLSLDSESTFLFEFGLTDSDRVDLNTGELSLGDANLAVSDLGTGSLDLGDSLTLFSYLDWDGTTFNGLDNGATFSAAGYDWEITYDSLVAGSLNGGDGEGFVTMTVIPEPGTLALVGVALAVLGLSRFRQRRR